MPVKDKKWFQALRKLAPKIAAALGGPFGGLAETVLEEVLGKPADEAITEIAKGNPAVFAQLKEAELKFEQRMAELEIEETDLYLKDVASARAMKVATKDWVPATLTFTAIIFFGFLAYTIIGGGAVEGETQKFLWYLLGSANAFVVQGFNFFLGSSKGSQRKTDMMHAVNGGPK
jgi:hypothetical protein